MILFYMGIGFNFIEKLSQTENLFQYRTIYFYVT